MLKKIRHEVRYVKSVLREKSKSKKRSSLWDETRDEFVKKHPECAACGAVKRLQVHHILPFHIHPELELDTQNLIVLCMDTNECHLIIGHGGSYSCYNPNVIEDAKHYKLNTDVTTRKLLIESCKRNRKND